MAEPSSATARDPRGLRRAWSLVHWSYMIGMTTILVVGLVAVRLLLMLLAIHAQTGLAGLASGVTEPLVAPFTALLGNPAASGSRLDIPSLMAIVYYGLVGSLFAREIRIASRRRIATPADGTGVSL
jgi:hypothetical protein